MPSRFLFRELHPHLCEGAWCISFKKAVFFSFMFAWVCDCRSKHFLFSNTTKCAAVIYGNYASALKQQKTFFKTLTIHQLLHAMLRVLLKI